MSNKKSTRVSVRRQVRAHDSATSNDPPANNESGLVSFADLVAAYPELQELERRAIAGEQVTEGLMNLIAGGPLDLHRTPQAVTLQICDLADLARDWLEFCRMYGVRPYKASEAERREYTLAIALHVPFGDEWRFTAYDPMRKEVAVTLPLPRHKGSAR